MLQQILKDMYIDPDVLDALNDEQKKTLFLKMRQEQVRRWKEREEKLEREGGGAEVKRAKPKRANSKTVSWLLGRDGDVAVIVIGEVDELSSKFISGIGEKKEPSLQNNTPLHSIMKSRKTTEAVRNERDNLPKTPPGISLNLKEKQEEEKSTLLPLPVSVSEHSSPSAAHQPESKSAAATEEKSQPSVCSRAPVRTGGFIVRPAAANAAPGAVGARHGFTNQKMAAAAASSEAVKTDSGTTTASTASGLSSKEPQKTQESQGRNDAAASEVIRRTRSVETGSSASAPASAGRGRVAQLMKTFSTESSPAPPQAAPRGFKPALPSKPNHLRVTR